MPELILPRVIRGLGNAFGFPGGKTGPRGVDLSIDPQTVADLTQFARYGSARLSDVLGDGWVGIAFTAVGGGGGTITSATFTVNAANLPTGFKSGDVLWIRRAGITIDFSGAAVRTDFASAALVAAPQTSQTFGPGTGNKILLVGGLAANQMLFSSTQSIIPGEVQSWVACPEGSVLTVGLEQAGAAAGEVNALAFAVGRILPAGVPPTP